ncbi:MAG: hypothetical protein FJ293_12460 [Planctomycetes bacterium]|nr:hypothetical protein [Planctomycetota bacterium]
MQIVCSRIARLVVAAVAMALLPPIALAQDAGSRKIRRMDELLLTPSAQVQLAALNAESTVPFHARRSPIHGAARVISGGKWRPSDRMDSDPVTLASEFLARHHALLELPGGLPATPRERTRRVHFNYTFDGLPILGLDAIVQFSPDGEVIGASASAPGYVRPLGRFVVQDGDAGPVAIAAVLAETARDARAAGITWSVTGTRRAWRAERDGLIPVLQVGVTGDRLGHTFEVLVDARNGNPQRVVNRVKHGDGVYPWFGTDVAFDTKSASGTVFKSVDAAIDEKGSSKSLKNWAKGVPAPVDLEIGYLTGAFADIWDEAGENVFDEKGKFKFDPYFEPDDFDQVNTYYQIDTFATHLEKTLKVDLASAFSLPVIVNYADTEANAFFSADSFELDDPGEEHTDGYLAFYDWDPADSQADASRDPTTVAHEYTHAWLYFEGITTFEDPDGYPTGAGDEAFADFFASAWSGETTVFRYCEELYPWMDASRDLQDDDFFIDTVVDAIFDGEDGLPEPHTAGEVLGSLLTDLWIELGYKAAENLVYDAMFGFPTTTADLGYPIVDGTNAIEATGEYFYAIVDALFDAATDEKQEAAIVGYATGRGIIGDEFSVVDMVLDLSAFKKEKIVIPGWFNSYDLEQSYYFTAPEGSTLSVTIIAEKDGVLPDFEIYDAETGDPFVTFETKERKYTSGDRKVTQKGIELLLDGNATYEIVVSDDGVGGYYTLTLDL